MKPLHFHNMLRSWSLAFFGAAIGLGAAVLSPQASWSATTLVFTGRITAVPDRFSEYNVDNIIKIQLTLNPSFDPSTNGSSCNSTTSTAYSMTVDYSDNSGLDCSESIYKDIKITGTTGSFNNLAFQTSGSSETFDANVYGSALNNDSGLVGTGNRNFIIDALYSSNSNISTKYDQTVSQFVGLFIPGNYLFANQETPYFGSFPTFPGGPINLNPSLTPSGLIAYYYNNSFYRDYGTFQQLGNPFNPTGGQLKFGEGNINFTLTGMDIISEVPAPLPLAGTLSAFAYCRRIRSRISINKKI